MATINILHKGICLHIEYDYQPYERPETGIEAQYAGQQEYLEIEDIIYKGESFMWLLENEIEELEEITLKEIKDDDYRDY